VTALRTQQCKLLEQQFRVLASLQSGLDWSFDRLPTLTQGVVHVPATNERVAAIVHRFARLQDQFECALRHARITLGEKGRSLNNVIGWAVGQDILPDTETWLMIRSLSNRLTHEYDLGSGQLPDLIALVREAWETLTVCIERFATTCRSLGLLETSVV